MMAAFLSWKVATVKGEGDEDSSGFARMDGQVRIERLSAAFLYKMF